MSNVPLFLILVTIILVGVGVGIFLGSSGSSGKVAGAAVADNYARPVPYLTPTSIPDPSLPTAVVPTVNNSDIQVLKGTYSVAGDLEPKSFTVKSGLPVRLEVFAQDNGQGCMGSLALPGLAPGFQGFVKGQIASFTFTPAAPGTYQITCAMGVPHGTLIVE